MNVNLLIDAIVRQTVVLIAQLATAGGLRTPLAHVANQVFLDLASELKAQGLGQKVIADMFGMALRSYHAKVRRLNESATFRGRSLWEAVLEFIRSEQTVSRAAVMRRFSQDDEVTLRGVLNDVVDSGLVYRTGRGDHTSYRAADAADIAGRDDDDAAERVGYLVWVGVNRLGPVTREALLEALPMPEAALDEALRKLLDDGRIQREAEQFRCDECVIPYGDPVGFEAALFDHYQALVTAMCAKLQRGQSRAVPSDAVGGSTYGLDVWADHPMRDEVLGQLGRMRDEASALRARLEQYNADHPIPEDLRERVIIYLGQTVLGARDGDGEDTKEIGA